MKPSSAKAKGRTFQNQIASDIREVTGLEPADCKGAPMGTNGADIVLSTEGARRWPFAVEAKSLAAFAGYSPMAQAINHSKASGLCPMVTIKANGSEPLVILLWSDFLTLWRERL